MANKQIRKVSDLPKWFNLKKYASVKNLTDADWFEQLTIRGSYLYWLIHDKDSQPNLFEIPIFQLARSARDNPIINIGKDISFNGSDINITGKLKNKDVQDLLAVQPLTAWKIFDLYHSLPEHLRKEMEDLMMRGRSRNDCKTPEEASQRYAKLQTEYDELSDKGNAILKSKSGLYLQTFRINMKLPDSILKEHFELQLEAIRRTSTYKNKLFESFNPEKWLQYKILAYMDLYIWSLEEEKIISTTTMADILFPEGELHKDNIRKTIKPLVRKIINQHHVDIHSAVIAGQILGSKKRGKK